MVAYSFNKQFVDAIRSGRKHPTIRANRKRHARPGEMLQLYTGMRTRTCTKIVPDVVCTRLDEVRFDLSSMADINAAPATYVEMRSMMDSRSFEIAVNGMPLHHSEHNRFAWLDGFTTCYYDRFENQPLSPFDMMVLFWMGSHGSGIFSGVMISWEPVT
jgi:uncharacterized protein YqfB (UPF0267 family)